MPGYWAVLGRGAGAIVLYAVVGLVLMLVGFYAIDLTTPGPLRKMVDAGKPNAIIVSAAGMVSMALIVVLAIYSSSGKLAEGLMGSAVFGLVGIIAQVVMMRIATMVIGIDMDQLFDADEFKLRGAHGGRRAVRARHRGGGRDSLTQRSNQESASSSAGRWMRSASPRRGCGAGRPVSAIAPTSPRRDLSQASASPERKPTRARRCRNRRQFRRFRESAATTRAATRCATVSGSRPEPTTTRPISRHRSQEVGVVESVVLDGFGSLVGKVDHHDVV